MDKTKFEVSFIHLRNKFYFKILFGIVAYIAIWIYCWTFGIKKASEFEIAQTLMLVLVFLIFVLVTWLKSDDGLEKLKRHKNNEIFINENGLVIDGRYPKLYNTRVKFKSNNIIKIMIEFERHYGSDLSLFQGASSDYHYYKVKFENEEDYKLFEKWCQDKKVT